MSSFDYTPFFEELQHNKLTRAWAVTLSEKLAESEVPDRNGNLGRWDQAIDQMPCPVPEEVCLDRPAVTCRGVLSADRQSQLEQALLALSPWRKGPFELFGIFIDTEWRSNLKWDRLAPHLELGNKCILDVGCGNGYYGWRMLGAGARLVVGLDPYLLYLKQFHALSRLLGPWPNYVLPAGDTDIPPNLRLFDTVFSMGVLYHRKSPIEHLQSLHHALVEGGELVLETLVITGDDHQVLLPRDRYAQMKNVWFLPTCALLERMLTRCGFSEVRVVDLAPTTVEEQRSTRWMSFESLPNFLHPDDPNLTVEGYPAPLRAVLLARK